jgi:hypothetical protein
MLANGLGVVIAWLMSLSRFSDIVHLIEKFLYKNDGLTL